MRIALSGKYGAGKFSEVDDADFERLSKWSWHGTRNGYAARRAWCNGKKRTLYLHWEVLRATPAPKKVVDHKDRDRLNNRRSNLHFVSVKHNVWNSGLRSDNTSGFKGVSFNTGHRRWKAECHIGGYKSLGYFKTAEEAHKAYETYRLHLGLE